MKVLHIAKIQSNGFTQDFWRYQVIESEKYIIRDYEFNRLIHKKKIRIMHHARSWEEALKILNKLASRYTRINYEIMPLIVYPNKKGY
jgi:hypothetical protein